MSILEDHNMKKRKEKVELISDEPLKFFKAGKALEVKNIYIFFEEETEKYSRAVSDNWRIQSDHKVQFRPGQVSSV